MRLLGLLLLSLTPLSPAQTPQSHAWVEKSNRNALRELRADTEKVPGPKFNVQKFHDFILSQGLPPLNPLRKAVMADFVH